MKWQSAHQGIIPGHANQWIHAIHGKSSERPGDRPGARTAQKLWEEEELIEGGGCCLGSSLFCCQRQHRPSPV